jgi:hypothetical protein
VVVTGKWLSLQSVIPDPGADHFAVGSCNWASLPLAGRAQVAWWGKVQAASPPEGWLAESAVGGELAGFYGLVKLRLFLIPGPSLEPVTGFALLMDVSGLAAVLF